jgi:hypothetical protein
MPGMYVDTDFMVQKNTKTVMYKPMGALYRNTLFVDLVKFTPGSDGDELSESFALDGHIPQPSPRPARPASPPYGNGWPHSPTSRRGAL